VRAILPFPSDKCLLKPSVSRDDKKFIFKKKKREEIKQNKIEKKGRKNVGKKVSYLIARLIFISFTAHSHLFVCICVYKFSMDFEP
jgi:hypothetical protein